MIHSPNFINSKEGFVTVKNGCAMGMVAVAVGVTALSSSAALAFHRADLIESLQEIVASRTACEGMG
jgi:hypothetical protein